MRSRPASQAPGSRTARVTLPLPPPKKAKAWELDKKQKLKQICKYYKIVNTGKCSPVRDNICPSLSPTTLKVSIRAYTCCDLTCRDLELTSLGLQGNEERAAKQTHLEKSWHRVDYVFRGQCTSIQGTQHSYFMFLSKEANLLYTVEQGDGFS